MDRPIGRPRTCDCGVCQKCFHRDRSRLRWQAKSLEERRAIIARRDQERVREADRARSSTPDRRAHITRNTARWRREHPEKWAAHKAVAGAVRRGDLVREPCEVCGATVRVHAHHDDYSKPLDVRWLCALHHAEQRR